MPQVTTPFPHRRKRLGARERRDGGLTHIAVLLERRAFWLATWERIKRLEQCAHTDLELTRIERQANTHDLRAREAVAKHVERISAESEAFEAALERLTEIRQHRPYNFADFAFALALDRRLDALRARQAEAGELLAELAAPVPPSESAWLYVGPAPAGDPSYIKGNHT